MKSPSKDTECTPFCCCVKDTHPRPLQRCLFTAVPQLLHQQVFWVVLGIRQQQPVNLQSKKVLISSSRLSKLQGSSACEGFCNTHIAHTFTATRKEREHRSTMTLSREL
jgi:hypothetical protein